MTNLDLTRLRELAEKADEDDVVAWIPDKGYENQARFCNAANPATVLALIDKIESLQRDRDKCRDKCGQFEKQIDWLAEKCKGFCESNPYCNDCAEYPEGCPITGEIKHRFTKYSVSDWREAARKAVGAKE